MRASLEGEARGDEARGEGREARGENIGWLQCIVRRRLRLETVYVKFQFPGTDMLLKGFTIVSCEWMINPSCISSEYRVEAPPVSAHATIKLSQYDSRYCSRSAEAIMLMQESR